MWAKMMRPTYVRASVGSRMSGSWLSATTRVFFGAWAVVGPAISASSRARPSTDPVLIQLMAAPPSLGITWARVGSVMPASVLDAPEQPLGLRAELAADAIPVGDRDVVDPPQLGDRLRVVVDAQV